jgi:hypothetical protein
MADLRGTEIKIATEGPEHQAVHTVRLEFGLRQSSIPSLPSVRLWLHGGGGGSMADLGPDEAREVARYLLALADSVEQARR